MLSKEDMIKRNNGYTTIIVIFQRSLINFFSFICGYFPKGRPGEMEHRHLEASIPLSFPRTIWDDGHLAVLGFKNSAAL